MKNKPFDSFRSAISSSVDLESVRPQPHSISYPSNTLHPFQQRAIHVFLFGKVKKQFDDEHFQSAVSSACSYVEHALQIISNVNESGSKLTGKILSPENPVVSLSDDGLSLDSALNQRRGYLSLFNGMFFAIRNPHAHEPEMAISEDECLDHLCLVSILLRRIEKSGFSLPPFPNKKTSRSKPKNEPA